MIGELIRVQRKLKGWSQLELGRNAGVAYLTINRLEQGKNTGSAILDKVSRALGMQIVYELKPLSNDINTPAISKAEESNIL